MPKDPRRGGSQHSLAARPRVILTIGAALGALSCSGEGALVAATSQRDLRAVNEDALVAELDCDALLKAVQAELLDELARLEHAVRLSYGLASAAGAAPASPLLRSTSETSPGACAAAPSLARLEVDAAVAVDAAVDVDAAVGVDAAIERGHAVIEGDYFAAEGDRAYMLEPRNGLLYVLAAWPPAALSVLEAVPIEGAVVDLLVHERVVAVFSRVGDPLRPGPSEQYPEYAPIFTKITVFDTTAERASVRSESYVEGDYVLSRRQGAVGRAVLQQTRKLGLEWPVIADRDATGRWLTAEELKEQIEAWARSETETIRASTLDDYLPAVVASVEGLPVQRSPVCPEYFVAPGAGLGATSVVSVDLAAADAPPRAFAVHGGRAAVSIDADSLIVRNSIRPDLLGDQRSTRTQLHLFALDGAETRYVASGSTAGIVQEVEEHAGCIRLATGQETFAEGRFLGNSHHVVVAGAEAGRLTEVGRSPELGANEAIGSVRFEDERAYVVAASVSPGQGVATHELIVLDLSEPSSPRVTGRVGTLGNIGALLPVSRGELLGIAQGDPDGVAVQLFDVSDASAPAVVAEHVYPDARGTRAASDARAIRWLPERGLLAFPLTGPSGTTSTLEVFELAPDAVTRLGGVVPEKPPLTLLECLTVLGLPTDGDSVVGLLGDAEQLAALRARCEPLGPGPDVERGLFRENTVFAIGTLRLASFALDALGAAPASQLSLPWFATLPDEPDWP